MGLYKLLLLLREAPWGKKSGGYLGKSRDEVLRAVMAELSGSPGGTTAGEGPSLSQEKSTRGKSEEDWDTER